MCLIISAPAMALSMDVAQKRIAVTTGFAGAEVSVFGVRPGGGDVIVVLSGPKRDMTVRKKEQVAGAWLNRESAIFKNVPTFYDMALSAPIKQIASGKTLRAQEIGIANRLRDYSGEDTEQDEFTTALIRNKRAQGVFPEMTKDIVFMDQNFFRAGFYLPAGSHTGTYDVTAYYFENGRMIDSKSAQLKVELAGASAEIASFARDQSFLYGILCIAFAVFAGWLSNRIRRRS